MPASKLCSYRRHYAQDNGCEIAITMGPGRDRLSPDREQQGCCDRVYMEVLTVGLVRQVPCPANGAFNVFIL